VATWIQTYTGRAWHFLTPGMEEVVCLEDIAHALSMQARFNGHTAEFYSVAQHSVLVSQCVGPANTLWGLLHDAAEAYVGDMVSPLKHTEVGRLFEAVELHTLKAIAKWAGLRLPIPNEVREVDRRMLATEAQQLFQEAAPEKWKLNARPYPHLEIVCWSPNEAEEEFIRAFEFEMAERRRRNE